MEEQLKGTKATFKINYFYQEVHTCTCIFTILSLSPSPLSHVSSLYADDCTSKALEFSSTEILDITIPDCSKIWGGEGVGKERREEKKEGQMERENEENRRQLLKIIFVYMSLPNCSQTDSSTPISFFFSNIALTVPLTAFGI